MKPLAYPARIRYHRADRAYLVEFPDLPGCLTYGTTKAEALANAEEAGKAFKTALALVVRRRSAREVRAA